MTVLSMHTRVEGIEVYGEFRDRLLLSWHEDKLI
jgi:hypothetical protein